MIAFTPIDIPKVSRPEEICHFFEENKITQEGVLWHWYVLKNNSAGFLPGRAKYMADLDWQWDQKFSEQFPEFVSMVEALPFTKVTFVNLLTNKKEVASHQDLVEETWNAESVQKFIAHHKDLEPCVYRILLKGDQNHCGFFLSEKEAETDSSKKMFVKMPSDTSTFAMNGTQLFHGADKMQEDKLLCFISGFVDREKHAELIKKSMQRFPDFVIKTHDV